MIDQIIEDARSFCLEGKQANEVNIYGNQVELSFRNVGKWVHDEERDREFDWEDCKGVKKDHPVSTFAEDTPGVYRRANHRRVG